MKRKGFIRRLLWDLLAILLYIGCFFLILATFIILGCAFEFYLYCLDDSKDGTFLQKSCLLIILIMVGIALQPFYLCFYIILLLFKLFSSMSFWTWYYLGGCNSSEGIYNISSSYCMPCERINFSGNGGSGDYGVCQGCDGDPCGGGSDCGNCGSCC
jgi:hypothetical protein